MLPNFLVIGAAKAGTTSLYEYLRRHPEVFVAGTKELNFFVGDQNWVRGRAWYERQFDGAGKAVAIGEISPRYAMYPVHDGVPRRVAGILPEARLIYLVRHPVERMRSHYLDGVIYGAETSPIDEALLRKPVYLSASRYALQIEQYLAHFPSTRLLVVTAEAFRAARGPTLRRIFEFLGADPSWQSDVLRQEFHRTVERRAPTALGWRILRSGTYRTIGPALPRWLKALGTVTWSRALEPDRGRISAALDERLRELLREDVRRLARYVDGPFEGWGIA